MPSALRPLLLAATLGLAGAAEAQVTIGPAAFVNDQAVTNYDIDQRARLLLFNGAPESPQLGQIAFSQLIEDRLKLMAGETEGVGLDDVDPDDAVRQFAEQRGLSLADLEAALAQRGASLAALRDALTAEAVWREAVRRRFGPRAQPSEAEIDQEFELAASGSAAEYQIAEIVLPDDAEGRGRELAEQLSRELAAGADFETLARRHSAAPSAAQGGEVGWISAAALPPEAVRALEQASVGEATPPFRAAGGVAILQRLDVRRPEAAAAGAADDPEAREAIRRRMIEDRLQRFADAWLQELRADAVIEQR
jgi:parvulin-like peptidyl-prolyl isomerase